MLYVALAGALVLCAVAAGLLAAQNRELQSLLLAKGHDIGAADGMIGAKTREAIKAEAARLGLPATGRAGQNLLQALRK